MGCKIVCIKKKRCYKINPKKFNVISISLGPLQIVTDTISDWKLKALKRSTLADGLIERTSPMLDEIASKIVHKDEKGDQ